MLLGSRIIAQRVTDEELRSSSGRSTTGAASGSTRRRPATSRHGGASRSASSTASRAGSSSIEQARVLQDTGNRLGIVTAIAGYIHADVVIEGRADHAGATPMDFRLDVAPVAARVILEVERLAREAGEGTVGTVGELELQPGIINVVPGRARLSLDTRGVVEEGFQAVARGIESFAQEAAAERGLTASYGQRQTLPVTRMDARLVAALEQAAGRQASRSCSCTRARLTTRCALPTTFRAPWSSCRAATESAMLPRRRPTRPTQLSAPRSSSPPSLPCTLRAERRRAP